MSPSQLLTIFCISGRLLHGLDELFHGVGGFLLGTDGPLGDGLLLLLDSSVLAQTSDRRAAQASMGELSLTKH